MGTCTDLASKAELQALKEQAGATKTELVKVGALGVTTWAATLGFKDEIAANFAQGQRNLNEIKNAKAAAEAASKASYNATRQALIAKGQAIAAGQSAFTTQALLQDAQATANSALATANQAVAAATSLAARLAALLASVAITVASFALTQGQLRATQARIDQQEKALEAYNADYTRLINLISQNKIAIEANNTAIEATNATVRNNQNAIAATNSLALDAQSTNRSLATSLNEANARINSLVNELNAVNSKVDIATSIAVATKAELAKTATKTELNSVAAQIKPLDSAIAIANQKADAAEKKATEAIEKTNVLKELVDRLVKIIASQAANAVALAARQAIAKLEPQVKEIKAETQQERLRREYYEKLNEKYHSQEELRAARQAEIDSKNKSQQELKQELKDRIDAKYKSQTELKQEQQDKINKTITKDVEDFRQEITKKPKVDNKTAQEINKKLDILNSKFPDPLTVAGIATAVGGLDILRQIKNKPIPTPTCLAPVLVPPVGAGVTKANVAIGTMQSLTLAQGAGIKTVVTKNFDILSHSKHGLEAVQKFADTAWKATHADKILNGITTALVIHNAIMLSNNLGQTIGDAASGVLNAIGIKDSEGNPFNVNTVIRAKMTQLITSAIGSENYAALTAKVAAANRIYQSAANVLDLTRSLFDSARNVAELTAENTGKIGNALREAGAVYEDAYDLMQEKVNPQNQAQRRLEGLSNTLGNLAEGASAISEISSEAVETRENITQLKAERKQLEDETKLFLDAEKVKKDEVKAESQAETELAKIDFAKDETDD